MSRRVETPRGKRNAEAERAARCGMGRSDAGPGLRPEPESGAGLFEGATGPGAAHSAAGGSFAGRRATAPHSPSSAAAETLGSARLPWPRIFPGRSEPRRGQPWTGGPARLGRMGMCSWRWCLKEGRGQRHSGLAELRGPGRAGSGAGGERASPALSSASCCRQPSVKCNRRARLRAPAQQSFLGAGETPPRSGGARSRGAREVPARTWGPAAEPGGRRSARLRFPRADG